MSRAITVALLLAAAYLLYLAVPSAGPAWRAARGEGKPGIFTAQRLDCVRHPGHERCSWTGGFGTDDGAHRDEVTLHGVDRRALREGERVEAFDIGRSGRVYASATRRELVTVTLMLAASAALLASAGIRVRGRAGNSRRHDRVQ